MYECVPICQIFQKNVNMIEAYLPKQRKSVILDSYLKEDTHIFIPIHTNTHKYVTMCPQYGSKYGCTTTEYNLSQIISDYLSILKVKILNNMDQYGQTSNHKKLCFWADTGLILLLTVQIWS